ncbi:MAG: PDZ domain-containing protein [Candidatus Polarisedimenticolia bacterium]
MSEKARTTLKFASIAALPALLAAGLALAVQTAPRAERPHPAPASPVAAVEPVAQVAAVPSVLPAASPRAPEPPEPPSAPEPPSRRRAWLGIMMDDGARITQVVDGSPAEEAGLKRGDRIVEINGEPVEESEDVIEQMRDLDPGDSVRLRVKRDGEEVSLKATLESRKRDVRVITPAPEPFEWHHEGSFSRGYLGVQIHPMSGDLRAYFKAPRDTGLLVNKVMEDTPAEKAGMKAGDVILSVDGQEVSRIGDIGRALREHEEGDKVSVRVMRDGSERTLEVEIEDRPDTWMSPRSFRFNFDEDDGDDDAKVIILPRDRDIMSDEQRKALEESMKALRESMKTLKDERIKIQHEIRNQLRDQRRDVRRARIVNTTYDI